MAHPRAHAWSSYRVTAGETAAPPWLTVDWVLAEFARTRAAAQRAYRAFVAEGIRHPTAPWAQVVGQVYLGSDAFLAQLRRALRRRADGEIPRQQRVPHQLPSEEVLRRVARAYGVSLAALCAPTRRPSEARQVAVYALRREASLPLVRIARRMGLGYTAVSRRVGAGADRVSQDRNFRQRLTAVLDGKVKT